MSALQQARGIEAIAVRRATVVDAGKVRYRVYSSPTEFVAVIAESALMAVKVAGVNVPFRIVRDLPTDIIALEAEKIAKAEAVEKVKFSTTPKLPKAVFKTEIAAPLSPAQMDARFVPLKLRDLGTKKAFDSFIVPHEILNQLIEAVRKPAPPPAPPPEIPKAAEAAPVVEQQAQPPVAPPAPEAPKAAPAAAPSEDGVLSKDEVDKLLNE